MLCAGSSSPQELGHCALWTRTDTHFQKLETQCRGGQGALCWPRIRRDQGWRGLLIPEPAG